jgi:cytochrome b6-f complex iron-sulfur subunit
MADQKKMSVDEILAAARAEKSGQEKPAQTAAGVSKPAAPKPAAAVDTSKKSGPMSVADVLAAARGEKSPTVKPAASAAQAAKPAKPKTADTAATAPAKAAGGGEAARDTSSILAAARKAVKPGPMSKAEAADRGNVQKPAARPTIAVPPLPEKPAYAQPRPKVSPAPTDDRRGFLSVFVGSFLAVGFTSVSAVFGLWTLGTARLMFPNILTEPPNKFKVGFPSDFAPGTVENKFKAQFGVWIVNTEYDGQPEIVALKTVCTHLGCTPNWLEAEQKFKCPCHGSGFDKAGINFEGPAPRPLERYAIRLADDGQLEVDKSRKFQEEMGQWRDPASFVPV